MDEDRFYEDEQPREAQGGSRPDGDGEVNEVDDLDRLFNFLIDALTQASAVPLTNKRIVNVDMCLDAIDNIRDNLPEAIQYANQIYDSRDRIIAEAETKADAKLASANARANSAIDEASQRAQNMISDAEDHASRIVMEAEKRARAMVEQSEITRQAHSDADKIVSDARAEATNQRMAATRYAEELLLGLQKDMQASMDAVRRSLDNLGKK